MNNIAPGCGTDSPRKMAAVASSRPAARTGRRRLLLRPDSTSRITLRRLRSVIYGPCWPNRRRPFRYSSPTAKSKTTGRRWLSLSSSSSPNKQPRVFKQGSMNDSLLSAREGAIEAEPFTAPGHLVRRFIFVTAGITSAPTSSAFNQTASSSFSSSSSDQTASSATASAVGDRRGSQRFLFVAQRIRPQLADAAGRLFIQRIDDAVGGATRW